MSLQYRILFRKVMLENNTAFNQVSRTVCMFVCMSVVKQDITVQVFSIISFLLRNFFRVKNLYQDDAIW